MAVVHPGEVLQLAQKVIGDEGPLLLAGIDIEGVKHPIVCPHIGRIPRYDGAGVGDIPEVPPASIPIADHLLPADVPDDLLGLGVIDGPQHVGELHVVGVCCGAIGLGEEQLSAYVEAEPGIIIHGGEDVSSSDISFFQQHSCLPHGGISLAIRKPEGLQISRPHLGEELGPKEPSLSLG